MYKESLLKQYLDDLAAKMPAPGGGSAAAMSAAMGASLVSMVINFTLGKPRYAAFEEELVELLDKSEKLRRECLDLVDRDIIAYQSKNMRDALDIPFMLARLSFEGMKLCPPLIEKGNVNLISDVAVAAIFFESAYHSALFNVKINLKTLGDEKLSRSILKELNDKSRKIKKLRKGTEERVGKIIGR
ncbi:MAG TPA: cyclodeaminase/cyclohydrolase family protein [Candidatus Margulisiibacteriota bacterium]|nr:cyclodeaminase/cyclohydrolase family protein [Candidatus Margulisiibacteriota bacterium]